ncbi:MAG: hypothetical protein SPG53_09985 [Prevotella sp.]|nr:hypothetical protein [Prevotella sp.]
MPFIFAVSDFRVVFKGVKLQKIFGLAALRGLKKRVLRDFIHNTLTISPPHHLTISPPQHHISPSHHLTTTTSYLTISPSHHHNIISHHLTTTTPHHLCYNSVKTAFKCCVFGLLGITLHPNK